MPERFASCSPDVCSDEKMYTCSGAVRCGGIPLALPTLAHMHGTVIHGYMAIHAQGNAMQCGAMHGTARAHPKPRARTHAHAGIPWLAGGLGARFPPSTARRSRRSAKAAHARTARTHLATARLDGLDERDVRRAHREVAVAEHRVLRSARTRVPLDYPASTHRVPLRVPLRVPIECPCEYRDHQLLDCSAFRRELDVPAVQGKQFSDSGTARNQMPRRSEPVYSPMPPHRAATPEAVRRGITQAHTAGMLLSMCVHACARWLACKRVCAQVCVQARARACGV